MTGPIIPAYQWPEDAVLHTWDKDGRGYWTVCDKVDELWTVRSSHIPMPDGWDWRVPVMRPTVKDSLMVPPAIDLEQFRCLVDFVLHRSGNTGNLKAAYDLLALINGQGKEPATHYHCAEGIQGTAKRLRRYAKLNKTNLMGQTMEEAAAYIDAMQPTKGKEEADGR